jgi:DNA-binding transcriptional LysR family regulator
MRWGLPCVQCMILIVVMHEMDLRRIDLNLLVALDVLLDERSVTRAAERLGRSQPAVSRCLARLREVFADPLLVEGRGGYLLSERAEAVRPRLRRALAEVGALLAANDFDPATAGGELRLMMPDLLSASLAPPLLARLATEAPGIGLEILPPVPSVSAALESDLADALVGLIDAAPAGVRRRSLYRDSYLTLLRAGHPAAAELTLERYLELRHVVVSVTGVGPVPVDVALAALGRRRTVSVRIPSFLAAVEIVAGSDLVITLPATLARRVAGSGRLVAVAPPLDLGGFTMSLVWHARHQDTPRHAWLRRSVVAAAATLATSAA